MFKYYFRKLLSVGVMSILMYQIFWFKSLCFIVVLEVLSFLWTKRHPLPNEGLPQGAPTIPVLGSLYTSTDSHFLQIVGRRNN